MCETEPNCLNKPAEWKKEAINNDFPSCEDSEQRRGHRWIFSQENAELLRWAHGQLAYLWLNSAPIFSTEVLYQTHFLSPSEITPQKLHFCTFMPHLQDVHPSIYAPIQVDTIMQHQLNQSIDWQQTSLNIIMLYIPNNSNFPFPY